MLQLLLTRVHKLAFLLGSRELNLIELIWAQVKNVVCGRETTFKMKDVKVLLKEETNKVTPQLA